MTNPVITKARSSWLALSPASRLAIAYVSILLTLSLVFSAALYSLATAQLTGGLRHQYNRLQQPASPFLRPPQDGRQFRIELDSAKAALALQLIYFNIVILAGGSALSFLLAKQTLKPIEDALEAQTRFAADASHELRTPLTTMQTEIEVLLRARSISKVDAVLMLKSNLEEVEKLRALSDGLLRLARGERGMKLDSIKVCGIVGAATERIKGLAKQKEVSITSDIPNIKVVGDSESLIELLVILLDNAIKYSPSKSIIEVVGSHQGNNAVISVNDAGKGIAVEDLPYIFDRFYRADKSRTKDSVEGFGLGLSIAQQIALLNHGEISVASEISKGSTFSVRLPLA